MKLSISLLSACLLFLHCATHSAAETEQPQNVRWAVAIHGGAGKAPSDPIAIQKRTETLKIAVQTASEMLKEGNSSLDTVESVIRILEDEPNFNAGKGAVMNAVGKHELDASIMEGKTRSAGAVGGVSTVRNPISLARLVMTETKHVLLVTDGAEKFADRFKQIRRVPNRYFSTDRQRENLERSRKKNAAIQLSAEQFEIGTVGCVALDVHGNIAAGTSTGGLTNKKYGRVGDSPIIGAGTFADNHTCGVSCTGIGEDFIKGSVAFDVSARMAYGNQTLKESVNSILHKNPNLVRGGIIAVGRQGEIALDFNTQNMSRAAADSNGHLEIHVTD